jgi:DNA-binding NarL/FixJ family response regulator
MLERAGVGSVIVCESAEELSDGLVSDFHPQLIVIDPDGDAGTIEHLRTARAMSPRLTVIAVSARSDAVSRASLEGTGPVDFITKCGELSEIEAALDRLIRERLHWSSLTARELEILALVAEGRSNREVAASLWVSDQTVKFHLANVYRKLGVGDRRQAVDHARREGLLPVLSGTDAYSANGRSGEEDDPDLAQLAAL